MFSQPVLGEVRPQVLLFGVEELDELSRLRDPRVAAQKLIAILLQELEAQQGSGGALLALAAPPRLPVYGTQQDTQSSRVKHAQNIVSCAITPTAAGIYARSPRNLGRILSDVFSLLGVGKAFFICFCNFSEYKPDLKNKKKTQPQPCSPC